MKFCGLLCLGFSKRLNFADFCGFVQNPQNLIPAKFYPLKVVLTSEFAIKLAACSNLSCCIKFTFKPSFVIPTLLAAFKIISVVAHLFQMAPKIGLHSLSSGNMDITLLFSCCTLDEALDWDVGPVAE